jgi:phosphoglycolate phosphatase
MPGISPQVAKRAGFCYAWFMKTLLFDFDGVIADTFHFCYRLHKAYRPESSVAYYKEKLEGNIYETLKDESSLEVFTERQNNFMIGYKPELMKLNVIETIGDVITTLAKDYALFIVSSCDSEVIREFLTKEKLADYFQEILGCDVDFSKIRKIHMLQEKYKFESNDALFITDTLGDIREAEKCQIKSIAVSWGFHPQEKLRKWNPMTNADKPLELVESIREKLKI